MVKSPPSASAGAHNEVPARAPDEIHSDEMAELFGAQNDALGEGRSRKTGQRRAQADRRRFRGGVGDLPAARVRLDHDTGSLEEGPALGPAPLSRPETARAIACGGAMA